MIVAIEEACSIADYHGLIGISKGHWRGDQIDMHTVS